MQRAISILEYIADKPARLSDVADHLGVHKSTALRLLQTLAANGFAQQQASGTYTLGIRLIGLASEAMESLDLRTIARPHLVALSQMCGHTVHLASLFDREVVYIDKHEGLSPIRMYSRIGRTAEIHASAVGKIILASVDSALRDRLLAGATFKRFTPTTITSRARLLDELEEIRLRGYGFDRSEFEDFVFCLAAPVRSADRSVYSAISITVPKAVVPFEELERHIPDIVRTAEAISRDCGWNPR